MRIFLVFLPKKRYDYFPFGMLLPGRHANTSDYRYGFNGKELDNELKGEGLQIDYGFRVYDPRLGKFLSEDPLTASYPWYTPYQFAGNTPIQAIDLDGLEEYHYLFTLDEQGNSQITLEGVKPLVEWGWGTFWFERRVNESEKHIVHYRPKMFVVAEFQGVMAEQDFTETYDNEYDAFNTTYDDFNDDFLKFEFLTGFANGAAFRGNTRNMPRNFKKSPTLLSRLRDIKSSKIIDTEIKVPGNQSVIFKAKEGVKGATMSIKDIYMYPKGAKSWKDKSLVGKAKREILLFRKKMIENAREKGMKTLLIEFYRTPEGSTARGRAMIMEVDVKTGKTIKTQEISASQHQKNISKDGIQY